jgi:hypothetical protein
MSTRKPNTLKSLLVLLAPVFMTAATGCSGSTDGPSDDSEGNGSELKASGDCINQRGNPFLDELRLMRTLVGSPQFKDMVVTTGFACLEWSQLGDGVFLVTMGDGHQEYFTVNHACTAVTVKTNRWTNPNTPSSPNAVRDSGEFVNLFDAPEVEALFQKEGRVQYFGFDPSSPGKTFFLDMDHCYELTLNGKSVGVTKVKC